MTMGALKEKITGFVSVTMDTLKCIAEAFARDSDERKTLGGLNEVAGEDIMTGLFLLIETRTMLKRAKMIRTLNLDIADECDDIYKYKCSLREDK